MALTPSTGLLNLAEKTVLILGSEGYGRMELGKALAQTRERRVRMASELPLEPDPDRQQIGSYLVRLIPWDLPNIVNGIILIIRQSFVIGCADFIVFYIPAHLPGALSKVSTSPINVASFVMPNHLPMRARR